MKQMVRNSLEKVKQKSKEKVNIFNRIKNQNPDKITSFHSKSKLI